MSWLTNSSSHTFRLKVTAITLMLVIFWHVPCTPSGTDPQIVPLKRIKCHDHLNKGVPTEGRNIFKSAIWTYIWVVTRFMQADQAVSTTSTLVVVHRCAGRISKQGITAIQ